MPQTAELITIGRQLAQLAGPGRKDLLNFASDIGEAELTLKWAANGLDKSYERMSDARTADERDETERHALQSASRSLQRAIVSIAQIVGEIEIELRAQETR